MSRIITTVKWQMVSTLELRFEYELSKKIVYNWWTDLSGDGFVGKSLKSLRPIGKDGEKILVETKWVIMGMMMTLVEKLSLFSDDHWVWKPHFFSIDIIDDFTLTEGGGKTILVIRSTMIPQGVKGRILNMMFGGMLKRMMVDEWKSASIALVKEVSSQN